jgi:hypothetical protein
MVLACYLWYHLALAAPLVATPIPDIDNQVLAALGNRTALTSELGPAWATTSNVRGTSDIIWSCLVTLTVTVYTAIHLNVPAPGESQSRRWLRKAKWVVIAIFGPEVVLYTAFQQWQMARLLVRELNYLRRSVKGGIKLTHVSF